MANPEHMEILKQGVEVWNRWQEERREKNPLLIPDLSNASLRKADLRGVDFEGVELKGADLSKAYLGEAILANAGLSGANLSGVFLQGAEFTGVDLSGANLNGANIEAVYLSYVDLSCANLSRANLAFAIFTQSDLRDSAFNDAECLMSVFADVDLSQVKGLESIKHDGPSIIGLPTLYNSEGNIPEAFLRGCGVPDQMIEYARSLTANPIEYYSCFISYSHKDEEFAKRLHADLQAKNVRCWYAPHDMKIGDKIRPTIDDSIRIHDKLLLILSEHSVESDWVEHEVEHALDIEKEKKKNVLFPVRVDEAAMESKTGWAGNVRRHRHIGDFTQWKDHDAYSKAFERLLRDLKAGL
ncbi:toll/interleukin-1 receptor domain-containing protein [Prosthecochloris sp.]|uniref:toll/interleukin-1 receptor domain-containing protein n=1 Tax=Prosthecochloris sp. TaxID=290513 RepID=UPI0025F81F00|nr:toll/interleukin-1 receptor domain-containing protein [Prosthecochloris sp.]